MKTKQMLLAVLVALMTVGVGNASRGATNDVSALLQKGLLEEEANHNLEAAIQAYQAVVTQTEKERQFAATAVFRLGECYRKLGRTNEANVQYQRILKEFSDQTELAKLSQGYLGRTGSGSGLQAGQGRTTEERLQAKRQQEADPEAAEIEKLKAMIKDSPDLINARSGGGNTPLHKAAELGQLKVVSFLLDNKADIEAKNNDRYTPLLFAAERGNREMVELLLNRGADATASCNPTSIPDRDASGSFTALHFAAYFGYRAIAEILLAHGAKVGARTDSGQTPLHMAATKGFKSVAELLLAKGADVNAKDNQGVTPLMKAATAGNRAIVEWLLANKADVNSKANNGWTALHSAIERADNETARLLLENKADPNLMSIASDPSGRSPLMIAAGMRNTAAAELLTKSGANVNATNLSGYCALQAAMDQNDEATVELLLENKADPNIKLSGGWSLLQLAVGNGRFQIAEALISHGANVNTRNHEGQTPLHLAVGKASKALVELLLAHGADVNIKDNDGNTALDLITRNAAGPNPASMVMPGGMALGTMPPRAPTYAWNAQPGQSAVSEPEDLSKLLREHGAVGELERSTVRVFQKGMNAPQVVFRRDSKALNRYSLLDVLCQLYRQGGGIAFPDCSHISITHGAAGGTEAKAPITVDLLDGTNGIDCSKDRWLEFGDIVEIPEREHALSEQWRGMPDSQKRGLFECVSRKVKVVVKGQVNEIFIGPGNYLGSVMNFQEVLKVLLSSSDLTRLKVSRTDPVTKKPIELTVNAREPNRGFDDLWVRDGDVIEVPDKQ